MFNVQNYQGMVERRVSILYLGINTCMRWTWMIKVLSWKNQIWCFGRIQYTRYGLPTLMPIVMLVWFDNEDNSYIVQAPLALCQSSYLLGWIIDVVGWGHCGLILAYAQVGRSESDDFVDDDDDDKGLFINNIIIFGRSLTPPHPLII